MVKFIEIESIMVIARDWGGEVGFNEYRISVLQNEEFWRWIVEMIIQYE